MKSAHWVELIAEPALECRLVRDLHCGADEKPVCAKVSWAALLIGYEAFADCSKDLCCSTRGARVARLFGRAASF